MAKNRFGRARMYSDDATTRNNVNDNRNQVENLLHDFFSDDFPFLKSTFRIRIDVRKRERGSELRQVRILPCRLCTSYDSLCT
jgi:hypothetical protein